MTGNYRRTHRPHTLTVETLEPRMMLAGDGLVGEYFNSTDLTNSAGTRTDALINYPNDALGEDAQGMVTPDDQYSIRWTGWVLVDQAGQWQFTTFSNDGVRLWVDDQQLIDNWGTHTSTRDDGQMQLTAGWHAIRLEYFQQNGTTDLRLLYSGPGQAETLIPQSHLCTTDPSAGDPSANAGPDRLVFLPENSVTLDGAGVDDSQIESYAWTQLSGPSLATLSGENTDDLTVTDLVAGVYEFQLTVTDNDSNAASDIARVIVSEPSEPGLVTGELRKWHKTTITFDGPSTSESAAVNPFLDYRLDVAFTHTATGKTFVVPGYYAADGAAGNSHATGGEKWRVHFAPDEEGEWSYLANFRGGDGVAVADDPSSFASGGFFDGAAGVFHIQASDKSGRDFRGQGRLEYVGERYLRFADSGEYFLKQGPDAPENLLAYRDFDGSFKSDGESDNRIKDYTAHLGDWSPGDPAWDSEEDADSLQEDGKALIGALNYLASEGLNVFSFLTMNIGGDDRNVFPYVTDNADSRTRMDVSRLDQWEIVFEHADKLGLYLHFKTQETENDQLLDGGALGPERKLYYREMIARFSHHLALNWNLGEENTNTDQQRKDFAQYFSDTDPYNHHIVIHTYPGQKNDVYTPLLGAASQLTGASLQTSNVNFSEVHDDVLTWVTNSQNAGKPWVVAVDEPGNASDGLVPDGDPTPANNQELARKRALWGTLMAGGAGNEWYFGYQHDHSDLTLEDFRSRDQFWDVARYSLEFFADNDVPFWRMNPDDGVTSASDDYAMAEEGETYLAYLPNGGATNLDLSGQGGLFEVQWYDPRNGGPLQEGSVTQITGGGNVSLGNPPNSAGEDWVVLVRRRVTAGGPNVLFIRGSEGSGGFLEGGSDEQLGDINNFSTAGGNHGWGTLAETLRDAGLNVTQVVEGATPPSDQGAPVPLTSMDLGQYDVLVFGSNNAVYTPADRDAFEDYLRAGGGALFISDANFGSDWADAPNSDQQFLDLVGVEVHQDQGTYVVGNSSGEILESSHPIFAGVSQFDGEGVSPLHVRNATPGATVTLLAGAEGQTRLNTPPFGGNNQGPSRAAGAGDASLLVATLDAGRLAGHFDRNTFFNQNGAGTNINRFDNQQYALNLFRWAAGLITTPGDYNRDSYVDQTDYAVWRANYGATGLNAADGNGDGVVDAVDYAIWREALGSVASEPLTVAVSSTTSMAQEPAAVAFAYSPFMADVGEETGSLAPTELPEPSADLARELAIIDSLSQRGGPESASVELALVAGDEKDADEASAIALKAAFGDWINSPFE